MSVACLKEAMPNNISSSTKPSKVQLWWYSLVGGCIGGGAGSLSAWLGLAAAKAVGIDVPTLNWKAMGVIFLGGVLTHGMAFLAKSPLPELGTGNTEIISRSATQTTSTNGKDT